jgi:demethylmenaquinone methyltransferase/2-methoxy-6-polyprenyl-1,4-benzoquinol methylase
VARTKRVAQRIATPEGKRQYVRLVFAKIADRYDLITALLSFGRDRGWKRRLIRRAQPLKGMRALDLATGTGDIAISLSRHGALVTALDVTPRMIELARAKVEKQGRAPAPLFQVRAPIFIVGDMLALPFPDESFDIVTTGYGLRNVIDLQAAIDEIQRVLKPGGVLLSLDFDRPTGRLVRTVYLRYLSVVGGVLGWVLHRDPDTYRYIAASIRTYPGAAAVAEMMRKRGFTLAHHYPLLLGFMAMHHARKRW